MLMYVNGKAVGGMRPSDLERELERSGREVTLTISRYNFPDRVARRLRKMTKREMARIDNELNDYARIDWIDIGLDLTGRYVNDADNVYDSLPFSQYERDSDSSSKLEEGQNVQPMPHTPVTSDGSSGEEVTHYFSLTRKKAQHDRVDDDSATKQYAKKRGRVADDSVASETDESLDSQESEQSSTQASKVALGCPCGTVHKHPVPVFWILCDGCEAWYNASPRCVGFTIKDAEKLDRWLCWACAETDDEEDNEMDNTQTTSFPRPCGPSPDGLKWDTKKGVWFPIGVASKGDD
jgi:hypothetical protein